MIFMNCLRKCIIKNYFLVVDDCMLNSIFYSDNEIQDMQ